MIIELFLIIFFLIYITEQKIILILLLFVPIYIYVYIFLKRKTKIRKNSLKFLDDFNSFNFELNKEDTLNKLKEYKYQNFNNVLEEIQNENDDILIKLFVNYVYSSPKEYLNEGIGELKKFDHINKRIKNVSNMNVELLIGLISLTFLQFVFNKNLSIIFQKNTATFIILLVIIYEIFCICYLLDKADILKINQRREELKLLLLMNDQDTAITIFFTEYPKYQKNKMMRKFILNLGNNGFAYDEFNLSFLSTIINVFLIIRIIMGVYL